MNKLLVLLCCLLSAVSVAHGVTLKVGVLSPDGSTWAVQLKKMAKEIKTATEGKVKFKFYFGGSQGDEPDVLKKMRIGQLHGGVFTGKTLGDINKDVRVLELPFTFYNDISKAHDTLRSLTSFLNKGIEANKLKSLGLFGLGMVYFVSQKKVVGLKNLKGIKIWYWEGDKVVKSMIDLMNLTAVPIPLPDVLHSLQTGILEAAYAPPLGIVALQWHSKVNYLVDFPMAFAIGGFVLSQKGWAKMKAPEQAIVEKIAAKYIRKIETANMEDNKQALHIMKEKGVVFLKFSEKDRLEGKEIRGKIINKLQGKEFSLDVLKRLQKLL